MSSTYRRWRAALVALAAVLVLPLAAPPASAAPAAATPKDPAAKVDRKVRDQIAKQGTTTFWVVLTSQADLTGAKKERSKVAKASRVRESKIAHADKSQAELRKLLDRSGATYTSFWIHNSLKVTGDAALVDEIAARPEVAEVEADEPIALPKPFVGTSEPTVDGIEWNIDRVNAPRVWNELGVRGEGIVVANIDSGVQFDHPALAAAYRGKSADGTVDHNYNWFDPTNTCVAAPCDNNDHGTHTMGTMVGDDGTNQIGVAPGAKWVAAKGCATSSCARDALLAAGQWIVAPTDLNGQNPRPELSPDIVNNSWGSSVFDTWYKATVESWVAAGIFPAFSNGNNGSACDTTGSPGGYSVSYSSGAFDINNAIASFSSRGPGENDDIKPNISAPGVNVRSSVPGGFGSFSGTSMASPHTAAVVALMWSASPAIMRDIAATQQILDDTALDVNDTRCGGTADDNNTWGEGRLDAYAAVSASPRGALGALTGTITSGGVAVEGATVTVSGPMSRTATTGADGTYRFDRLMVGEYTVTAAKFGYLDGTGTTTVAEGETATLDLAISQAPSATLSGTVSTAAGPAAGATVTILGTPLSATADANGRYSLAVPHGDYDVKAEHASNCAAPGTSHVSVTADTTLDIALPLRTDDFGYGCSIAEGSYVAGVDKLNLSGDDVVRAWQMPFPVAMYGRTYRSVNVSTNGFISFTTTTTGSTNRTIPSTVNPDGAVYAFWDDLIIDEQSGVYTTTTGTKPNRSVVVEWRNVARFANRDQRMSFSTVISENGTITTWYDGIDGTAEETGSSATIGLENADGTEGFEYSFDSPAVASGTGITFRPTRSAVVTGTVTDANDRRAVEGAVATAAAGEQSVATDTVDADGIYLIQVPAGDVTVTLAKEHYESSAADLDLAVGSVTTRSAALRTARVTTSAAAVDVVAPAGQSRQRTFTLTNAGGFGTDVTVVEANASGSPVDIDWLTVTPGGSTLAPGATQAVQVTLDASGMETGTFRKATLLIRSASGRAPQLTVPVTLVAPGYQMALDVGGNRELVDTAGDVWFGDRAYTTGSCGYQGRSGTRSTNRAISGTTDAKRYQTQRESMYEYRFDGLAPGVYTVELNFAELRAMAPDRRVFDVLIEGVEVLPSLDVANEAGSYAAVNRTYTVQVTDGQLNVRFITHAGYSVPILNAIRVTDRPDQSL